MLLPCPPPDRCLTSYPPPYLTCATPIRQTDWSPATRSCATTARSVLSHKIAKMILVGDCSVGKTSLVNRLVKT